MFYKLDCWSKRNVFISGVVISMTASIILTLLGYIFAVKTVNDNIASLFINMSNNLDLSFNELENQITEVQTSISNHNEQINELETNLNSEIENSQKQYNELKSEIKNNINIFVLNSDILGSIQSAFSTDLNVFSSSGIQQFDNQSDELLEDLITGQVYTVGDFKNETLVLHYIQNGEDVFFKGQYDENGYWDENCIINRYSNGKLVMIMDAIYDSGVLISYEQVFTYKTSYGYDVWALAKRDIDGDLDSGYTETYFKYVDYPQNFDTYAAKSNDILNVNDFILQNKLFIEGYYSGYISDGYFNDDTGKAYIIKYFEPGVIENNNNPVIRMFYRGDFFSGQPNDDSYDSWYITRDVDTTYMYYRGGFSEGKVNHRDEKKEDFVNYLTHEQIDEYLKQYGFSEYSNQFVTEYENQE